MSAAVVPPIPPPPHRLGARLLRSSLVDLLLGPHGVDRYLELVRPVATVTEARAEVIDVRRQTPRSATLTLRPNSAWTGFQAGQFVRAGFEIGGVRRTRTYSPAGAEQDGHECLELTVTVHPEGLVSRHVRDALAPGALVHLGPAQGEFVLSRPRPRRLVLISGGSGVTPVMAMLRTLCAEGHDGEIVFLHYARAREDWLYEPEVRELARRHRHLRASYRSTRGPGAGPRLSADSLAADFGVSDDSWAAVCGPPALLEAARTAWRELGGVRERLLAETFTPAPLADPGAVAQGTVSFLRSGRRVPIAGGTLLEQAEAAGLSPEFGCRMGICHTCTCRKAEGAVRNLRTGVLSTEQDEDIQLCVSAPAGDVALEL
ncbi:MAG TPA: ferredoxin reductase [Solirubrobacteraceae bacterium]